MVKPTSKIIKADIKACEAYQKHLEKEAHISLQKSVQYYIDQKYEKLKASSDILLGTKENAKKAYDDYKELKKNAKLIALKGGSIEDQIKKYNNLFAPTEDKKKTEWKNYLFSSPPTEQNQKEYFFAQLRNPAATAHADLWVLKNDIITEIISKLKGAQTDEVKNILTSERTVKIGTQQTSLSGEQILGLRRKSVRGNNEENIAIAFRDFMDGVLHKHPLGVTGGKLANSLFSHFKANDKQRPTDSASKHEQNNRPKFNKH